MYIAEFLNYLQYEKRTSPHTIKSYHTDILQYQDYLDQVYGINDIVQSTHVYIRSWLAELMDNGLSARSVHRKVSSLRAFFKFLRKENVIYTNPLVKVIAPKASKKLPVFVEEVKMEKLFETEGIFTDTFEGQRDKLIMTLFYATGVRRAELINMKFSDVDVYNSQIKILGKRNKERVIPVTVNVIKQISDFRELCKGEAEKVPDYLFFTGEGGKIKPQLAYKVVKKYLGKITTISKKSPHVLRHTFATHMLDNGADINAIKEMLGHSSLAATQVYTHNTIEKLKNIHKQAHPRGE